MFENLLGKLILFAVALTPPELNDQTYTKWREYILPRPAEMSWDEVPWRSTLWDAVVEARRQEKPILLWAMNGHPLACT